MSKKIKENVSPIQVKSKASEQEFEKKVIELADRGLTAEKIGETLRKEGIHPRQYDKKISEILKEKNKYISPDVKNIEYKLEKIIKHYEKNRQDKRALRDKGKTFAKLRRLKKYLNKNK